MKNSLLFLVILTASCWAQSKGSVPSPPSAETQNGTVVLTKLSPPVFPRNAWLAHMAGDVELWVTVGHDGVLRSVELFSGGPVLIPAAMASAKQSEFECRGCGDHEQSYLLTYSFRIKGDCPDYGPNCKGAVQDDKPQIEHSAAHVSITVRPVCTCDPVVAITKVKVYSARCLYLWKCGWRVVESK